MKNTFSKSLVCGVIASTFLLANCQKAPSGRGVKSAVGDPGTATDITEGKVTPAGDVNLAMAKCSSELNSLYNSLYSLTKETNILALKKDGVDRKEDLLSRRQDINDTAKKVLAEMAKLKPDATLDKDGKVVVKASAGTKIDGCYTEDKKIFKVIHINHLVDRAEVVIADATGEETSVSKSARVRIEKQLTEKLQSHSYKVAKEFNELLEETPSDSSKYMVDGKIGDKKNFDEDRKNKGKSVCYVSVSARKLDDDKLLLKTTNISDVVKEGDKKLFSITFENGIKATDGADMYQIKCSIPSNLSIADGLSQAMGSFLTLATEKEKSAAEKVKVTSDKEKTTDETAADEKQKAQAKEDRLRDEKTKSEKAADEQAGDKDKQAPAPNLTTKAGNKLDAATSEEQK